MLNRIDLYGYCLTIIHLCILADVLPVGMATGSIREWRGRSNLARTIYTRNLNDETHKNSKHEYWYRLELNGFPRELCDKFIHLHQDEETTAFLENCYEKADWIFTQLGHILAKSVLSWFMTNTSINGYLGRGSMFVFSRAQFTQLLDVPPGWTAENMIDLGAGDGMVTEKMADFFNHTYTTETSKTMVTRLQYKGYSVLDLDSWDNGTIQYDLVSCLNLLDRCDKPMDILRSIKRVLRHGSGRVIVAVVLPFKPYVEQDSTDHRPTQYINVQGTTFAEQSQSFIRDVLEPSGFIVERFTRLPYLCEGDMGHSFYVLDDAVFIMKAKEER